MSIQSLKSQDAARTYVQNADVARSGSAARTKGAADAKRHQSSHKADSVSLSADARSLAAAREAVQSSSDVRENKVADIKQRVDNGTYQVPARVLARKMLDTSSTSAN